MSELSRSLYLPTDNIVPRYLQSSSVPAVSSSLPDFPGHAAPKAATVRKYDSLINILWRQRRMVIWATGIAFLLGAIYSVLATPQYTSTSRLYVRKGRPSLLSESRAPATSEDDNFLSTQREVISSTPVLALALSLPDVQGLRTLAGQANPFEFLKKSLSVEVGKKVDLLSVSFDSPSPQEADAVVAGVVKSYSLFETDQRQRAAQDAGAALSVEKSKWERELSQKTSALLAYRAANGIVVLGPGASSAAEDRLTALNEALNQAHRETLSARSQYEQIARQLGANPKLSRRANAAEPVAAVPSPEDLASLRQELAYAKARARELRRQYLPGHPVLQLAMDRVDELVLEQVAEFKAQLAWAEAKETDLQKMYEREQRTAIQQSAAMAECARLGADITRLQQLVDSVDSRIHEIDLTSDDSAVSISVLEPAHCDKAPTRPKKLSILGMALMAGFLVGATGACVRDRYDRRLSGADDVGALLGLNVLGQLPAMSPDLSPTDRARQAQLDPASDMAEACRSIRASLVRSDLGAPPKTLLITSPWSGDGRSTLASNLAISFAETEKRVLLLDADLRSPMQNWFFGLEKNGGVVAAVDAQEGAGAQLPGEICHTPIAGLDVLPAGPAIPNPARVLNDRGFADLLEKLADAYDHVIVDSPSLGQCHDARILAAHCDACLIVLLEEQHNQRVAEKALIALGNVGANVIGVVMNRAPSHHGQRGIGGATGSGPRVMLNRLAGPALLRRREEARPAGNLSGEAGK